MCVWRELLKTEPNFALHGLGSEVARLPVPLQQQELVSHLPCMDLGGGGRGGMEGGGKEKGGTKGEEEGGRVTGEEREGDRGRVTGGGSEGDRGRERG